MKEPTDAEILAVLQAEVSQKPDVDPSWKTTTEWAAAWKLSEPHARKLLNQARTSGTMKMERRHRMTGNVVRPVNCYRFVGKAKK